MAESSNTPPATNLAAHITALTAQVQENSNRFMTLEDENATLRHENRMFLERLATVEATPQYQFDQRFHVSIMPMQPFFTPEHGSSSHHAPFLQSTPFSSATSALIPGMAVNNGSASVPHTMPLTSGSTISTTVGSTMGSINPKLSLRDYQPSSLQRIQSSIHCLFHLFK